MSSLLTPLPPNQWNRPRARHLLNRAGFGIPARGIDYLAGLTPQEAVAALVDYERFDPLTDEPDFLDLREEGVRAFQEMMALPQSQKAKARMQLIIQQRQQLNELKAWWIDRIVRTPRPLEEKMTLFWSGHFAVSAEKVKAAWKNWELNQIFRAHATGNFRDLTFEVGKSPAMLDYLDNKQNRKNAPNENWARELMELFTLGIGEYTEEDIKEAARAFTGYTERMGEFTFVRAQHDFGPKKFLGREGNFDGADIIHIIFEQPQCAEFISRKLWEFFVYDEPSDALVKELAAVLRENDYELKPLLRAIFTSQEFYSPRAMDGQIKSPVQYLAGLQSHLGLRPQRSLMTAIALRALGQEPFFPPNVKGWDGNRAWINTNTLLVRYNIPGYVLTGNMEELRPAARLDEDGDDMANEMGPVQQAMARAQRRAGGRRRNLLKGNNGRVQRLVMDAMGVEVLPIFEGFEGQTAGTAVDQLADRFLGRPLDPGQRAELAASMAPGATPQTVLTPQMLKNDLHLAGTLHLMLSMAEYQLC